MRGSVLLMSVGLLIFSGCYHLHVVAPQSSDRADRPQPSRTVHALFWGLVQPTDLTLDCVAPGVADLEFRTNFGYQLLSVVTLGIWTPMEVQWTCPTDPQTEPHFPHPSVPHPCADAGV